MCMNTHDEYEKIAVVNDSGASETVVSVEKFESYPIVKRQQPEAKQRTSSTLARDTFESSKITARRVGSSFRCARDSVKTRCWEASAGWLNLDTR